MREPRGPLPLFAIRLPKSQTYRGWLTAGCETLRSGSLPLAARSGSLAIRSRALHSRSGRSRIRCRTLKNALDGSAPAAVHSEPGAGLSELAPSAPDFARVHSAIARVSSGGQGAEKLFCPTYRFRRTPRGRTLLAPRGAWPRGNLAAFRSEKKGNRIMANTPNSFADLPPHGSLCAQRGTYISGLA